VTEDPVALNDWYPVADAVPAPAHSTRLLGHPVRVAFSGARAGPAARALRVGDAAHVRADAASVTYRHWLREKGLAFGVTA
jgi:hypothetical protein